MCHVMSHGEPPVFNTCDITLTVKYLIDLVQKIWQATNYNLHCSL